MCFADMAKGKRKEAHVSYVDGVTSGKGWYLDFYDNQQKRLHKVHCFLNISGSEFQDVGEVSIIEDARLKDNDSQPCLNGASMCMPRMGMCINWMLLAMNM